MKPRLPSPTLLLVFLPDFPTKDRQRQGRETIIESRRSRRKLRWRRTDSFRVAKAISSIRFAGVLAIRQNPGTYFLAAVAKAGEVYGPSHVVRAIVDRKENDGITGLGERGAHI